MKKIISLFSVAAILLTMAITPTSAAFITDPIVEQGGNGIYIFAQDDFESYNTGVIMTGDQTAKTVTDGAVAIKDDKDVNIKDRWNISLSNGTASYRTGTASVKSLTEDGRTFQVFEYAVTASGSEYGSGIALGKTYQTVANNNKKDYVVLKARMKNALTTDDSAYANGTRFMSLRGGINNVMIRGWNDALKARPDYVGLTSDTTAYTDSTYKHYLDRGAWFDYMLIVSTTPTEEGEYAFQVVVDGEVTPVKGTTTENWASIMQYRRIGDVSDKGKLYIDDLAYFGVSKAENDLTCTPVFNTADNTMTLEFCNPTSLDANNITITDGDDATTESVSAVTFADGKFTVAFSGLEAGTQYSVTVTGASDVYDNTYNNAAEPFTFTTAYPPQIEIVREGFEGETYDTEKLLGAPSLAADTQTYTWAAVSTVDNSGASEDAVKLTITNKIAGEKTTSGMSSGGQFRLKSLIYDYSGNRYFVSKGKIRFGEPGGVNPIDRGVFFWAEFRNSGSVSAGGNVVENVFTPGEWTEVESVVDLATAQPVANTTDRYSCTAKLMVNGKYVCDYPVQMFRTAEKDKTTGQYGFAAHHYSAIMYNIYSTGGLDYSCVYLDDLELYTVDQIAPYAVSGAAAADQSISFASGEFSLLNAKATSGDKNLTKDNFAVTVGGAAKTVDSVIVANGLYTVVLTEEIPAGAQVVLTPVNVCDTIGTKLDGSISATAGSKAMSGIKQAIGTAKFLTVTSSHTTQTGVLFVATYENNRLKDVKTQEVTIYPGTNYYVANVEGDTYKMILLNSVEQVRPLISVAE